MIEVFFMLRFRRMEPADLPAMLAIYAPFVETTTVSFEYTVPTQAEFAARAAGITARYPWLVCEEDGTVVGYAYLGPLFERAAYSWLAEPSVYLAPQARRRGIGTALLSALADIGRLMGLKRLISLVTAENEASAAFHKKLGWDQIWQMDNCGWKFGRWLGLTWYSRTLSDSAPAPVIPFPALPEEAVDQILRKAESTLPR